MNKRILKYLNFFLLLILMSCFSELPIYIFKVDFYKYGIIYNFIMDILFIIIIIFIYRKMFIKDTKDYKKNFKKYLLLSLKYYCIGLAVMYLSNFIITTFFSSASANNDNAVRALIDNYPLYMAFNVSIYAPICEEIIFRKSIKDIVYSYNDNKIYKYLYIVISGLIFALLHVIGSVENNLDYLYIIPYLGLGIAFSALYSKTDNIYNSIIMHAMHNTITLILYLL